MMSWDDHNDHELITIIDDHDDHGTLIMIMDDHEDDDHGLIMC